MTDDAEADGGLSARAGDAGLVQRVFETPALRAALSSIGRSEYQDNIPRFWVAVTLPEAVHAVRSP
jgi:hypothetical protein